MHAQDSRAHIALADLYLRAGKLPEGARELRAAVRLRPDAVEAHARLAALYHDAGYLDREYGALRSVVALTPADWQSELRLANIAIDQGWFEEAASMLAKAASTAPQEPRVLVGQASLAYVQHKYAPMETAAREGLKRAPDNVALWVILSEACRLQRRLPEAEEALHNAIKYSPEASSLTRNFSHLAHLLLDAAWNPKRLADAEQAAQTALQKSPDDLEARYWLARAQEMQGRTAEAEANYSLAAKQDLQFEGITHFLGRLYQRSSDPRKRTEGQRLLTLYGQAEENGRKYAQAQQELQKNYHNSAAHLDLARWEIRVGQVSKAILELRRTLELNPHSQEARRLLGQTLRAAGRISEAKEYEH